ncbi:MAG: 50S rRNA methyltransferase [Chloroflexi bacterium]|nr:MAG: 50S rRNA methyltransferase [Chloroflexota bacterium]
METLAPGVLLMQLTGSFASLAARWRTTPPIFVRHICPVYWSTPLAASAEDLPALSELASNEVAPQLDSDEPFSVQTRVFGDLPYKPYDLNTSLAAVLTAKSGAPVDVRAPVQVVSVVCAAGSGAQVDAPAVGMVGLSSASDNLSDWAGGMRRFAREEGQISRSEFKLLEALEHFAIDLPAHGVALDLGAAPGGWTRILRQRGQYVTAVDPGDLDPRLANDRYIRHKRMTAEAYLADDPDTFDLIVNDMRMDARDSARLMVAYARHLYPHGSALMTLKLPAHNTRRVLDHALKLLSQVYQVTGVRQLFHNRSEVTVYLRPRAPDRPRS